MAKSTKASVPAGPNRLYIAAGAVVLLGIAAYFFLGTRGGSAATVPVALTESPAELQRAQGISMGSQEAPVVLYEFADYQCPACSQFSTFAHPLIKERLVDRGIARLVRYDFPIVSGHPHAFVAARAARCADEQGKYWEYHDVLYGRQPIWSASGGPPLSELEDYADLVGLERGPFRQCLRSDRHAEEVTRNLRMGESLGVTGTPTLMLNGQLLSIRDYNELEARVLEAAGLSTAPAEAAG